MSDDPSKIDPPADDEIRTVPPTPQGWQASAWAEFYSTRDHLRGAKRMNEALSGKVAAAEAEKAEVAQRAAALEARLAQTETRYAVDTALLRAGITDPEDMAEFRERYGRVEPDAEGKRPAPDAWISGLREKAPKWAALYFQPATPAKPADPNAEEDDEPAPKPEPKRPGVDPNAGAKPGGAEPPPRRWTQKRVEQASAKEVAANLGAVLAEAEAGGLIGLNPELRKRFGIGG